MELIKKYIWIITTVFLFATNIGTVVFFVKYYGDKISSATITTKENTDAVILLTGIVGTQDRWNKDHDIRHEDHINLHEAEHR